MTTLIGVRLTDYYTTTELAARGLTLGVVTEMQDGKQYKLVKFNSGVGTVAAVVGNFAYYYAVSGTSAGQITEVTMDLTDTAGVGAGVFQSIIPTGSCGWIQITGPATLTTALTAGADGNALTPTGAGADGTLDVSAAVTDSICAYAIDASAKIVMLCCPR